MREPDEPLRAVEMREVIEGGSRAFHKPQKVSSPTGMFIADPADVESLADRSSAQRLSSHGRAISSSSYSAARMSSPYYVEKEDRWVLKTLEEQRQIEDVKTARKRTKQLFQRQPQHKLTTNERKEARARLYESKTPPPAKTDGHLQSARSHTSAPRTARGRAVERYAEHMTFRAASYDPSPSALLCAKERAKTRATAPTAFHRPELHRARPRTQRAAVVRSTSRPKSRPSVLLKQSSPQTPQTQQRQRTRSMTVGASFAPAAVATDRSASSSQRSPRKHSGRLPIGWGQALSPEGIPYYFNRESGETTWERPQRNSPAASPPGSRRTGSPGSRRTGSSPSSRRTGTSPEVRRPPAAEVVEAAKEEPAAVEAKKVEEVPTKTEPPLVVKEPEKGDGGGGKQVAQAEQAAPTTSGGGGKQVAQVEQAAPGGKQVPQVEVP